MSFEKVLIVEDEPVVRNLQTEIFMRRKFAVSTAETLAQAETLLARESFDLVMLDIRLPDGDGQHFLERLATLPERHARMRPFTPSWLSGRKTSGSRKSSLSRR